MSNVIICMIVIIFFFEIHGCECFLFFLGDASLQVTFTKNSERCIAFSSPLVTTLPHCRCWRLFTLFFVDPFFPFKVSVSASLLQSLWFVVDLQLESIFFLHSPFPGSSWEQATSQFCCLRPGNTSTKSQSHNRKKESKLEKQIRTT